MLESECMPLAQEIVTEPSEPTYFIFDECDSRYYTNSLENYGSPQKFNQAKGIANKHMHISGQ